MVLTRCVLCLRAGTRTADSTPSSKAGRHHRRHSSSSVFSEFTATPTSTRSGRSTRGRRKRGGFADVAHAAVDPKWVCTICRSVMRLRSRHLQQLRDERCCGQCARKILRAAQLLYGRHTYPDIRSLKKMTARAVKRLVVAIQLTPAEFARDRAATIIQKAVRRQASGRVRRIWLMSWLRTSPLTKKIMLDVHLFFCYF